MTQFIITPEIFELYPDFQLGLIVANNIDNTSTNPEVGEILYNAEQNLILPSPISEDPRISIWREAYRKFGVKPKKYPSSIEALCKRVTKGDSLPRISPLVDLYNAISLECVMPAGAEDLDKMEGDIKLTISDGSDVAQVLGQDEPENCLEGEVMYADSVGPICRCFNWREVARCCISPETQNAIVVLEHMLPEANEAFHTGLEKLNNQIQQFCSADTTVTVLNIENPSVEVRRRH